MHHDLSMDRERADDSVGVRVAREQRHLEEEHGRRPDGRASPEPWENELSEERLDLEQKEGAEQDGDCEECASAPAGPVVPDIRCHRRTILEAEIGLAGYVHR